MQSRNIIVFLTIIRNKFSHSPDQLQQLQWLSDRCGFGVVWQLLKPPLMSVKGPYLKCPLHTTSPVVQLCLHASRTRFLSEVILFISTAR